MGQGTESCGGYDVEYDEYEEGLERQEWKQRAGGWIKVKDMSVRHMTNTLRLCRNAVRRASFTDDAEKWEAWVRVFENELEIRERQPAPVKKAKKPNPVRGRLVKMRCHCGTVYEARAADIARSWGLSCSKRCAAVRREFGRPAAKPVEN